MTRRLLAFLGALSIDCGGAPQTPPDHSAPASPKPGATRSGAGGADPRARALADTFLGAYLDRFPEVVTQYGVPGRRHDRLADNSLEAQKAWDAREDAWLAELKQIDAAAIAAPPLRATYAIVRQTIESDVAKRVCRDELWPVSQMTGWQVNYGYLVTIQPVGTDDARRDALCRLSRQGVPACGTRGDPGNREPERRRMLRRQRALSQLLAEDREGGPRAGGPAERAARGGNEDDRRAVVRHDRRPGTSGPSANRSEIPIQEPGGEDCLFAGGAGARQGRRAVDVRPAAEG